MTTKTATTAVWKYDINQDLWRLVDTATRNQRVLAEVRPNGDWRTFDTDGAGGESSRSATVLQAKEEVIDSLTVLGYV